MNQNVYESCKSFLRKYPKTIAWRVKKHAGVVQEHINDDEVVLFAFAGQKNDKFYDIFQTCVVVLTNKRILIGQKRVVWGYFLSSITPDLYNDLFVYQGLIWGKIKIDTVKEEVAISNLPKSGLDEIETNITEMMMEEKQKYGHAEESK